MTVLGVPAQSPEEQARERTKLDALIRKAQEEFDNLPPEEQALYKLAQKVGFIHGMLSTSASKEAVARTVLTSDVSAKYADYMLKNPAFRKALGLDQDSEHSS